MPNSSVTDLHGNEQFAVRSVVDEVRFNGQYLYEGKNGVQPLTISYDAASARYTLTTSEMTQTFAGSDIFDTTLPGTTFYGKIVGQERDILMLSTQPLSGTTSNKYVGYGYWQHDLFEPQVQNAHFNFFTYGFASPAVAVPRSGSAGWAIDLFGIVTDSGAPPYNIFGPGMFNVDFDTANFSAHVKVTSQEALTDKILDSTTDLWATGKVLSDGSFSGLVAGYGGQIELTGPIDGAFYGPHAEELGATISGRGYRADGTTSPGDKIFAGVLTGQIDSSAAPVAMTLTNRISDIVSTSELVSLNTMPAIAPVMGKSTYFDIGADEEIKLKPNGDIAFASPRPFGFAATFTSADKIGQTGIFDSYSKTVANKQTTLEMFRPGAANSEINLTYASFGSWAVAAKDDDGRDAFTSTYFINGFQTRPSLMMNRTGTAHYEGVVHGTGALKDAISFRVGGASSFDIAFTDQSYSGALDLQKLAPDGTAAASLGRWAFSGLLVTGFPIPTYLAAPSAFANSSGEIHPRFFGPRGEEIGALFEIHSTLMTDPSPLFVAGAVVAKEK